MHYSEVDETATGSANFWSGSNRTRLIRPLPVGTARS
jgi:hypothetical protein